MSPLRFWRRSLQWRLAFWLTLFISLTAAVGGIAAFVLAYEDAHEWQDEQLKQVAGLVVQARAWPLEEQSLRVKDIDSDVRVSVERLPAGVGYRQGFISLSDGKHGLRAYRQPLPDGSWLQVSQRTELRDEFAWSAGEITLVPVLVTIPLLVLVVILVVRSTFAPVRALAHQLDHERSDRPAPVPEAGVPREIAPFVAATNRLLERVAETLARQRRFVADAAHELRTPVAALSLQVENLAQSEMPPATRARLASLQQGLGRTRALLEQLLSLARMQSDERPQATPVDVDEVVREVLRDLYPQAEAKHIDLGVDQLESLRLMGSAFELAALVRNAVANAIHYTPAGGRVDLRVHQVGGEAWIDVIDNGPGIPVSERERVFEAFHRAASADQPGSGLGLAIVASIAQRLGGKVELLDGPGGVGLHFRYRQAAA